MKPLFFFLFLLTSFFSVSTFGQTQTIPNSEEPFDFITTEPIRVYGFDFVNDRVIPNSIKQVNAGIRFVKFSQTSIDATLGEVYVIQFYAIKPNETEANKKNTTLINSTNTANNEYYCIKVSDFDVSGIRKYYKTWCHNNKFSTGVLVLPIKLRPTIGETPFNFVSDFNVGTSLGWSFRTNHYKRNYLTIGTLLGVANVAVDSATTKGYITQPNISLPAITGAFSVIGEFSGFQLGFALGGDFIGGEAGKNWFYNERVWYSFGIGYQFLRPKEDK